MGKIKATTLTERFGFKDNDLNTIDHDKIVLSLLDNLIMFRVLRVALSDYFAEQGKAISKVTEIIAEHPLTNTRGYEIGFVDFKVTFNIVIMEEDTKWINQGNACVIEIKTKIENFGVAMRQLNIYRKNARRYEMDRTQIPLILITCDNRFNDAFKNQGIFVVDWNKFQKSMSHATPKPLDVSNGRRIPVESRSDSERDRPREEEKE